MTGPVPDGPADGRHSVDPAAEGVDPAGHRPAGERERTAGAAGPADGPDAASDVASDVADGVLLTVRPHRMRIYATVSSTLIVAAMIVVGLLLKSSEDGVSFRTSDQVALIGIGILVGAGVLLMGRPRLQVERSGLRVRNILGENFYPWPLVQRVAFSEGANWAQLALPDDETHPVMAIQALDRDRAVASLRAVRTWHARLGTPVPAPVPVLTEPPTDRPLGRLEIIDREKQAAGKQRRRG
ncbi:PH domain-containing protein [Nakamurella endophytica]|uniref:Low molecular weight protein antigen 6 PH domain-containing protein n=1 Tax=Nakamurella endophytica TaxID=1748367 RepID=A0A917SX73_9ACTN|nr:PH domain-containing protein [Nakamurella endophytica]GGM01187.1 hypothetical protein GCM10011594_21580 [Nakamurella endophytica]